VVRVSHEPADTSVSLALPESVQRAVARRLAPVSDLKRPELAQVGATRAAVPAESAHSARRAQLGSG